jgi:hypothetical protein
MQHRYCFEAVDRTLRDILRNDDLFGGITTIFGGDIAQILPVVRKGQRPQIVSACLQQSYIGARLQIRKLTENMRVQGADPDYRQFVQWLSDLSYVPELNTSTSLQEIDTQVYPDEVLQNAALYSTLFAERCILSPTNAVIAEINHAVLRRFPGESRTYLATNTAENLPANAEDQEPMLTLDFLQSLGVSSIPPA